MSGGTWDQNDLGYEDYDPNKDYSVQVKRNDGGLASTQVTLPHPTQLVHIFHTYHLARIGKY